MNRITSTMPPSPGAIRVHQALRGGPITTGRSQWTAPSFSNPKRAVPNKSRQRRAPRVYGHAPRRAFGRSLTSARWRLQVVLVGNPARARISFPMGGKSVRASTGAGMSRERQKKREGIRRHATSHWCRGVSPRRRITHITSPRLPAYETPGGHESRAAQVVVRRPSSPVIRRARNVPGASRRTRETDSRGAQGRIWASLAG